MQTKRKCSICLRDLQLHSFHRNKKMPLGRVYQCKECRKKQTAVSKEQLEKSLKERDERLRSLGKASKGRVWSEEYKKKMSERALKRKTQEDLNESRAKIVFWRYRDRGFTHDFEFFKNITQKNCHYCGVEPSIISITPKDKRNKYDSRQGVYKYNSIDRVNNELGYVEGNMVPCCDICNKAKRNLPLNVFLEWIERLKNVNTRESKKES